MSFFRTLSTARLIGLLVGLAVVAGGTAAIAVAATTGNGPTPPAKPLDQAIHDAVGGPQPQGITAAITFTNNLFPSGALTGAAASALIGGGHGRLWATNDGRGRLELQSAAGDAQVVWNQDQVTVFDASSNTVYKLALPATTSSDSTKSDSPPALASITKLLSEASQEATISPAQPSNVAGQPAYTVSVSPKHDGGLLGSAELAFDAARGIPLRVAVYAQGSSAPVLALDATNISYGAVDSSSVDVAPPPGAKVVDLGKAGSTRADPANDSTPHPSTVEGVQNAVGFTLAAPDALVGLPRQHVGLVGKDAALVVYGHGLGAIAVIERKADGAASGSVMSGVPTISLDGTSAHELATQLGTVLEWQKAGVAYVLAGSLPPAAAEAAARDLK